jgi:hypothetical protein
MIKTITLLLLSFSTLAQISITRNDINTHFTIGNSFTTRTDTDVSQVDIGQLGSTSWDFSSLSPNIGLDIVNTVVDPNSTPYVGEFPGSNLSLYGQIFVDTTMGENYSYNTVNSSSLSWNGNVVEVELTPGQPALITTTLDPLETIFTFPFTYNSTESYSGTQTNVTSISGIPLITTLIIKVSNSVVDAYGAMIMPGGRIVNALRVKKDEITIIQGPFPIYSRNISFLFEAKDGTQVIVPSDTVQSVTGVINNTRPVSWTDRLPTDVKLGESLPDNFMLQQNYPNPFNPSTKIEYSIPSESFVELKVYDVLGNEVAILVNEQRSAGVYRTDFNAANLPSGMYIARLTANEFTQVVKMTLLK